MKDHPPRDQGSLHLWKHSRQIQLWVKEDYRITFVGLPYHRVWRSPGVINGDTVIGAEEWT